MEISLADHVHYTGGSPFVSLHELMTIELLDVEKTDDSACSDEELENSSKNEDDLSIPDLSMMNAIAQLNPKGHTLEVARIMPERNEMLWHNIPMFPAGARVTTTAAQEQ